LTEAAATGERTGNARLINILSFFGPFESFLQELTTVDGASIWAGDRVHLTSNASKVVARKLMADLANGGQGSEPFNKGARLESVIPTPVAAGKKELAKSQPLPPSPVLRLCPPLLLSGQLPTTQCRRGSRSSNPSCRGGHLARGDPT
jgi:hypothetical protein